MGDTIINITNSSGSKTKSAAKAWYNKGNILRELDKHEESIECYDKAIELDPKYDNAWNNKGIAFHKLGKNEEALKCYDKAIELG